MSNIIYKEESYHYSEYLFTNEHTNGKTFVHSWHLYLSY